MAPPGLTTLPGKPPNKRDLKQGHFTPGSPWFTEGNNLETEVIHTRSFILALFMRGGLPGRTDGTGSTRNAVARSNTRGIAGVAAPSPPPVSAPPDRPLSLRGPRRSAAPNSSRVAAPFPQRGKTDRHGSVERVVSLVGVASSSGAWVGEHGVEHAAITQRHTARTCRGSDHNSSGKVPKIRRQPVQIG